MWVTFVNFETKEQSKQWMHIHSLNNLKRLNKRCLPKNGIIEILWGYKSCQLTKNDRRFGGHLCPQRRSLMLLGTQTVSSKMWSFLTNLHG
jgi:hypothetical protein